MDASDTFLCIVVLILLQSLSVMDCVSSTICCAVPARYSHRRGIHNKLKCNLNSNKPKFNNSFSNIETFHFPHPQSAFMSERGCPLMFVISHVSHLHGVFGSPSLFLVWGGWRLPSMRLSISMHEKVSALVIGLPTCIHSNQNKVPFNTLISSCRLDVAAIP